MTNMRILIKIVFVIFIAKGIECLGKVCDNCCDCFKNKEENEKIKKEEKKEENKDEEIKEYEEIKDEGNNIAKSLVNNVWCKDKKDFILKIFKKKDNNEDNGDKISIKLEGKDNTKITYLQKKEDEDPLKLNDQKYALFGIKTKEENTVYLYCSDVESYEGEGVLKGKEKRGIFEKTTHVSISVIACDTEKVTDMTYMFFFFSSLKILNLNNFNTKKVTNMREMFCFCRSLTKLDIKNFNTTNVTNMAYMFGGCNSLGNLDLNNFDTTNVTNMEGMFSGCSSLKELKFGDNFNTSKVENKENMFNNCINLPKDTKNKILGKNE